MPIWGGMSFIICSSMRDSKVNAFINLFVKVWNHMDTVIKCYKKCDVSNSLDGVEYDYL